MMAIPLPWRGGAKRRGGPPHALTCFITGAVFADNQQHAGKINLNRQAASPPRGQNQPLSPSF
jgi:hypothetical protein